ncbi:hypothetical protein HYDPIDRAFT_34270 [Hydnomerulius pinastri MD-312]|uniref:Protein kinase domain-containing protein n=1 Tax=Hydnomerulius pinastri MD-312 TaxID=994086 RepID=A0A0C9UZ93_9AGAM|nr:hypothetical protein HYDPIDRAFT_34270 [Hydnomerulius pinastri MD-312]
MSRHFELAAPPASSDGLYFVSIGSFVSPGSSRLERMAPSHSDALASETLPVSSRASSNLASGKTRSSRKRKRKVYANAAYAVREPKCAFGSDPVEFREQCSNLSSIPVALRKIYKKDWHNHVLLAHTYCQSAPILIEVDSTLKIIRAFTEGEAKKQDVEDRVLKVGWTPSRRPVQYFWSVQDFVKGLIGALRGHQFLSQIGILHRDVSENNIVLAFHPDKPRGLLIDFDMAVKIPEKSDTMPATCPLDRAPQSAPETSSSCDYKVKRADTVPYMSVNILLGFGKPHSYFDDVESFFYVLLLIFLSYNGLLPEKELLADHITPWPAGYQKWAGSLADAGPSGRTSGSTRRSKQLPIQRPKREAGYLSSLWMTYAYGDTAHIQSLPHLVPDEDGEDIIQIVIVTV